LEALPADYGAAGRDAYLRHRPLIMTALPEIEALVPKAALAARFLIGLVDSDLAAGVITTRRRIAEAILDKAAAEPAWRERLVTDPAATLRDVPTTHAPRWTPNSPPSAASCRASCPTW